MKRMTRLEVGQQLHRELGERWYDFTLAERRMQTDNAWNRYNKVMDKQEGGAS